MLVDARGVPLSLVASGANVHDVKLLEPTLAATVVERPEADPEQLQNLCADAGYKGEGALQAAAVRDYARLAFAESRHMDNRCLRRGVSDGRNQSI